MVTAERERENSSSRTPEVGDQRGVAGRSPGVHNAGSSEEGERGVSG